MGKDSDFFRDAIIQGVELLFLKMRTDLESLLFVKALFRLYQSLNMLLA